MSAPKNQHSSLLSVYRSSRGARQAMLPWIGRRGLTLSGEDSGGVAAQLSCFPEQVSKQGNTGMVQRSA